MRKVLSLVLVGFLLSPSVALAAVRGKQVMYMGGTITDVPERTKGRLDSSDRDVLTFTSPAGNFEIRYDQMTSFEYGQKAGRRLAIDLTEILYQAH